MSISFHIHRIIKYSNYSGKHTSVCMFLAQLKIVLMHNNGAVIYSLIKPVIVILIPVKINFLLHNAIPIVCNTHPLQLLKHTVTQSDLWSFSFNRAVKELNIAQRQ
jgi:hypothetical protein